MKNKENFKDEIVDIICDGDSIAVDKEKHIPVACSKIECGKCLFYTIKLTCVDAMVDWLNQEYKETVVISRNDSVVIGHIKDKYKYISRDENGTLYAYVNEPKKSEYSGVWGGVDVAGIDGFDFVLPMIKWTDVQPWKISDLKKLKVVEKY